jgi:hypothetical protein
MTSGLDEDDRARIARRGMTALSAHEGAELFDSALRVDEALMVPMRLDIAAVRALARSGDLPPLLSSIVRVTSPTASAAASLAQRLARTPEYEHERVALDLVRSETAIVLGHASPEAIGERQAFKDLGIDSLAAVEVRNRLGLVTGLRLAATLVFDHPTPAAVAAHLLSELASGGAPAPAFEAELDALESELPAIVTDERRRTALAARLQALISALNGAGDEADAAVEDDLVAATDEEIFSMIDKELGGESQ